MRKQHLTAALAATLFCAVSAAQAAPVTYSFNASNFTSERGNAAPVTSIAGTFTFDGEKLLALDLTIGTHSFSLGEVGYVGWSDSIQMGATVGNGFNSFSYSFTDENPTGSSFDDFVFMATLPGFEGPSTFQYTVADIGDLFTANAVSITDAPVVPVPAAAWLFGSGLAGLAAFARRHKRAAQAGL